MNQQQLAKMAHFIEITAAESEDSARKLASHEVSQQKYAEQVVQTVDALVAMGYIKQASREVAIQHLTEPTRALDQLVKMATATLRDPNSDESDTRLGTTVAQPGQQAQQPAAGTQKRASHRRFGAHGDKFVESLGLDPNNL